MQDNGDVAVLGLWGDSAPYNTRDSLFLCLWNVLSGLHHLRYWFTAFPKRVMCACGCKGRHTMATVWSVLHMCLMALLTGKSPGHRHDGTAFADSNFANDKARAKRAGKNLRMRGGLMQNGLIGHG